jgi:hypothetical protein
MSKYVTAQLGQEIFHYSTVSRPAMGPTQTPIQCAPGNLSQAVKRSGREADHSLPSNAEIKNGGAIRLNVWVQLHLLA